MKLPSADVKPAIQSGSISVILSTSDLLTGTTVGKAAFKLSVRPLLRVALIATIFCNPCSVKCSLFLYKSNAFIQSSKSPRFFVNNVYFSKCSRITCKSLTEVTTY
jgi:hypothetical protein